MKLLISLVVLSCALFEARGYPFPVFSSSGNVDSWSYGDANHGGRVLSRSYSPYAIRRAVRAPPTTYSLWQPEVNQRNYPLTHHQALQYQQADRRRQALLEVNDTPPQENEVNYPQAPEFLPEVPVEATEIIVPVEQAEVVPTTEKAIVPELIEPEIEEPLEEPVQKPKKAVQKKKQVKRPVEDEEDDDEEDDFPAHKFLSGAVFPMFFGWGGSGGPVAVANAYSTGKGGAAASDAIAYGSVPPVKRSQ
ncbi:hypothetical protein PYW08_007280 [Mythimna loreyi]|uniref:Uncharacterized protein n=1 Tax=Mythimna loreyi TaxID=667449 RepID=A0ACC2RA90_9NEOP|nr:hypothetical protein PYW08_007280 [Mythimna loreyi]